MTCNYMRVQALELLHMALTDDTVVTCVKGAIFKCSFNDNEGLVIHTDEGIATGWGLYKRDLILNNSATWRLVRNTGGRHAL